MDQAPFCLILKKLSRSTDEWEHHQIKQVIKREFNKHSLTKVVALLLGVKQLHTDGLLLLVQVVGPISDQVNKDCCSNHRLGKISLGKHKSHKA